MIRFIFIFLSLVCFHTEIYSNDKFRVQELTKSLSEPWGMTFVDDRTLLVTEKTGGIIRVNIDSGNKYEIEHNLDFYYYGQGGLLDILYRDGYVYVSYSEDRENGYSSTSIARGLYNENKIDFQNIFQAEPPINSGYHFGSRIIIKDKRLFASVGERGKGMIAQDITNHPGSIIRINLDGSIPEDNPKFIDKPTWLPEVYQIGVRNPQGMYLSPFDKKVYISNHGAKGGDFFGEVKFGENYGWKIIGWGGKNYIGTKIGNGNAWEQGFTKPMWTWTPSIAVSNIAIYKGEDFSEWNGDVLVTSLKFRTLYRLEFENNDIKKQHIVFEDDIGRIRDIEINSKGEIFLINSSGSASLWQLSKY